MSFDDTQPILILKINSLKLICFKCNITNSLGNRNVKLEIQLQNSALDSASTSESLKSVTMPFMCDPSLDTDMNNMCTIKDIDYLQNRIWHISMGKYLMQQANLRCEEIANLQVYTTFTYVFDYEHV